MISRGLPIPPLEMRALVGQTEPSGFDNPAGAPIFDFVDPSVFRSVFDFGCGCGRLARQLIQQKLGCIVRSRAIDLVIANAENIAGGSGITTNLFHKIRSYGVDVVTLGDHVYKRADIIPTLQSSERIVRPANLSNGAAGRFICAGVSVTAGCTMAVVGTLRTGIFVHEVFMLICP